MFFCVSWILLLLLIKILLYPVLYFLPETTIEKFDENVTKAALKILWVIWRVIKTSLLILLALIIFLLGPILWPVYLGILVLFPRFAAYIMSIKIF